MEEIKNLKDLSKIIDLARKKGVEEIEIQGIRLKLRDEAPPSNYKLKTSEPQTDVQVDGELSEEALLFWSAGTPIMPEGIN